MAHYFKFLPNFDYVSRLPNAKIDDYIQIKNFFKRGKIFEEIFNDLVFFEKYNIKGNERPDNVAKKFYGDATLDWVIFLCNNVVNVQNEWPLSQQSFDKVMLEKYSSYENLYGGIHHYETSEVTDSKGRVLIESGKRISPTWKTNGNYIETINSKIQSISAVGNRVTIMTQNDISFLQNRDEIIIKNIGDDEYNGTFQINGRLSANSFTYDLPQIPVNSNPVLSNPRVEEVRFTVIEDGPVSSGNAYYFEFYDDGLGYTVPIPSTEFVEAITNYDYEVEKEERKREIFLLKPQYLNILFQNLEEVMTYKEGGSQYINNTLKRGENSRIYNH
jgi:hypothetical protein